MSSGIIVKSKVKDIAKGMNVSGDFADALDVEVERIIQKAMDRAKANKRNTIQPRDI